LDKAKEQQFEPDRRKSIAGDAGFQHSSPRGKRKVLKLKVTDPRQRRKRSLPKKTGGQESPVSTDSSVKRPEQKKKKKKKEKNGSKPGGGTLGNLA